MGWRHGQNERHMLAERELKQITEKPQPRRDSGLGIVYKEKTEECERERERARERGG